MIDNSLVKKLNEQLKRGEQRKIAKLSGVSIPTVNRFFNGFENSVGYAKAAIIIEKAGQVIRERNMNIAKTESKIKKIIENETK